MTVTISTSNDQPMVETSFSDVGSTSASSSHPTGALHCVRKRRRVMIEFNILISKSVFFNLIVPFDIKYVKQFRPSPIALEPCADQKAAVLSLLIRLPSGTLPYTPPGQSGIKALVI